MASGYPMFGSKLSYVDYVVAHEFVDDITSATRVAGQRLSMDISRQTCEMIASNEALAQGIPRGTLLVIFLLILFAMMVHFAHATFSQN
jgi:hypothetical protein